jgi:hypothetical protein
MYLISSAVNLKYGVSVNLEFMLIPSNELRTLCRSDIFRARAGESRTEDVLDGESLSAEILVLKSSECHFASGEEDKEVLSPFASIVVV